MPKRVDHEQRRREIVEALWRVARGEGLAAVTLRRVAAEAGVSMNLVQYYFTTKDQLIQDGLHLLIEAAGARLGRELAKATNPRDAVRRCLTGLLPLDERSRLYSAVFHAYLGFAVTQPAIAALVKRIPHDVVATLAPVLAKANLDEREMHGLLAMADGLASGILVGTYSGREALELVDHRVSVLFGTLES